MPARRLIVISVCLSLLASFCPARAQTPLPPADTLINGSALEAFKLNPMPGHADAVGFSLVDAFGPGFARAWRVETKRDTSPMAAIELRALNHRALAQGDLMMVRFFARSVASTDETGNARVQLVVRRNGVDFNSSIETAVTLTREWQEFLFPFPAGRTFAIEECAFMFRFGFKRQTVELGGLDVLYYGKSRALASLPRTRFTYAGREANAAWRKAALERIERIRKSDFTVRVLDAAGRPLRNAAIRVEQRRAAFQFGSALQFARLVQDTPENQLYRQKALELFNAASPENDWKAVSLAGDWGADFNLEQSLAGVRWLRDHQLHARGHVLVWPGWKNLPKSLHDLRGTPREKEIPTLVLEHVRRVSRLTRDLFQEWDVLNEPFTNHDLMDIFGREIMPDWFKVARAEMPNAKLYFNDFSNHDATSDADHVAHFEETTRFLLEKGAPIDGLGLQAHISNYPNAPENVLKVLDRYHAKFKLPVRITEFDVWTDDEELQADYTRDFSSCA
jgi:endo-1,4-beta-xylanase